jgi:hypothetical protein
MEKRRLGSSSRIAGRHLRRVGDRRPLLGETTTVTPWRPSRRPSTAESTPLTPPICGCGHSEELVGKAVPAKGTRSRS